MKICVKGTLPNDRTPQPTPKKLELALMLEKFEKVLWGGYISPGLVLSLTAYFGVPKDLDNIRLVYDGTCLGLNAALWAPLFWMPDAASAVRVVSFYTYVFDSDFGEYFLNFFNDPDIHPYCGVDLTLFHDKVNARKDLVAESDLECWNCCFMALHPSPYNAIRYGYLANEFAPGDRKARTNAMRWDQVILNLPGSWDYDPALPWLMKWDDVVSQIAGDAVTFVDDIRGSGHCLENAWQVRRQYISRYQYLGIQDAPRKFIPPSQKDVGAWAGAVYHIRADAIWISVSKEKWDKG
jgi:hypothetical protein